MEPRPGQKESILKKKYSRRQVLRDTVRLGLGVGAMALTGCGLSNISDPPSSRRERQAQPTQTEVPSQAKEWLENGRALQTEQDRAMLNQTRPGIDMAYSQTNTIDYIRGIPDFQERILTAIGFLDVENSGRYSHNDIYTCNIYALDLLRLLLNHNYIGSRYRVSDGEPWVIGQLKLNNMSAAALDAFDSNYLALQSNNLDWWMQTHGTSRGWQAATTQQELTQQLSSGAVGLAVTNFEIIERIRETGEQPTGHALVNTSLPQDLLGISQSTYNVRLKAYPPNSTASKVNPEILDEQFEVPRFKFWTHHLL